MIGRDFSSTEWHYLKKTISWRLEETPCTLYMFDSPPAYSVYNLWCPRRHIAGICAESGPDSTHSRLTSTFHLKDLYKKKLYKYDRSYSAVSCVGLISVGIITHWDKFKGRGGAWAQRGIFVSKKICFQSAKQLGFFHKQHIKFQDIQHIVNHLCCCLFVFVLLFYVCLFLGLGRKSGDLRTH